jgi:flagellar L-ring protein FlgH
MTMTNTTTFAAVRLLTLAVTFAVIAGGCASVPARPDSDPRFTATTPATPVTPAANDGAIYHAGSALALFEDYKARRVGDVLNVVLMERTNARKSTAASTSKDTSISMANPVIAGRPVTRDGIPIFNAQVDGSRSFEGSGDAAQSNLLEGSIAVTVAEVLPNGNLVVQGEKWMQINQGREYIRIRGIVRPVDIRADNTVLSTQIANAELAYGGTGTIAHSASPGLLARFFNSPIWPF